MTVTLLHSSAADDNEAEEHSITSSRLGGGVAALGALGASGGGDAAAEVALTATVGAVIVPERACVSSAERACIVPGSITNSFTGPRDRASQTGIWDSAGGGQDLPPSQSVSQSVNHGPAPRSPLLFKLD